MENGNLKMWSRRKGFISGAQLNEGYDVPDDWLFITKKKVELFSGQILHPSMPLLEFRSCLNVKTA